MHLVVFGTRVGPQVLGILVRRLGNVLALREREVVVHALVYTVKRPTVNGECGRRERERESASFLQHGEVTEN